ncbi:MAG: hypothetical protein LDL31_04120 [Prosthecobacter sp.]|nr:hypothetical protein [Prosthecobacter sp.]
MKTTLLFLLLPLALFLIGCQSPPLVLADADLIPVGSRVSFWVNHDEDGWKESNLHIAYLPRPMTGAEARRWAEGVGSRDAGRRWTHYYVLVTPPGYDRRVWRSQVHPRPAAWEPTARRL